MLPRFVCKFKLPAISYLHRLKSFRIGDSECDGGDRFPA